MKKLMLLLWVLLPLAVNAQMPERESLELDYVDRHTGLPVVGTDVGRFQSGEPNVVIVPDGSDDTIVCRYRSAEGNCYRLSVNDGKGHVPVVLVDRASFDNWKDAFDQREDWQMCQIIENPWGEWTVDGEIPTAPGTHTYQEIRHCSTGGISNACPDTCLTETETRTLTVTNEVDPDCVNETWEPSVLDMPGGVLFYQTSNCGVERPAYGAGPVPEPEPEPDCVITMWFPTPDAVAYGQAYTQTSDCGDERLAYGTDMGQEPDGGGGGSEPEPEPEPEPVQDCGAWEPPLPGDPSEFYTYEYMDQTNSCGQTQRVYGTKEDVDESEPACSNTGWTPSASGYYTDETFTQTDSTGCTRPQTGTIVREDEPDQCTEIPASYWASIAYGYSVESDVAYYNESDPDVLQAQVDGTLAYIDSMNMNIFSFDQGSTPAQCI